MQTGIESIGERRGTALVTGASSGMGESFARELGRRGYNLLISALPGTGIERVAEEIRAAGSSAAQGHHPQVVAMEGDLTRDEDLQSLLEAADARGADLRLVVNNAGVDLVGRFEDRPYADHKLTIMLNVVAVVAITHRLLPHLRNNGGWILNVGSAAAFFPMPYKPIYSPSKRFVLNFSRALREEVRGSGVSVSCLCPGGVMTSPEVRERILAQGIFGRMSLMYPDAVARRAIDATFRGSFLIVPGWMNKLFHLLGMFVPAGLLARYIRGRFRRDDEILARRAAASR